VSATGSALTYQWRKGAAAINGATNSVYTISPVALSDAGSYGVVVTGACGSTNSATAALTINAATVLTGMSGDQSACVGGSASFSVSATGSALTYQWRKGAAAINGATNSTYTISPVALSDAGSYGVVVTGACGSTNSATAALTINALTTASPLANQVRNPGDSVVLTTTASGTGPWTYVWKRNGIVIGGQTGNSLVLTNLEYSDEGIYEVDVTGSCNTATQSASLHINLPPTVSIFSPTNGSVFIAPASFTVFANAQDTDGTIGKVELYSSITKIGETTNVVFYSTNIAAYSFQLTNLPPGTNVFRAVATDNYGLTGTSAPVTITVLGVPPLSIVSKLVYNPLTDLFEETVRVTNPTLSTYQAVRVYVTNLLNNTVVYNPSGKTNAIPYVESHAAILPGTFVDLMIEYYSPLRIAPNPALWAELVPPATGGGAALFGTLQQISRGLMLPNGTFLVEFLSTTNGVYSVEYSSDLKNWQSAQPSIGGTGTWIQWIDNGQPKTESAPQAAGKRFYKVISLE
jgi:hypothetical protein